MLATIAGIFENRIARPGGMCRAEMQIAGEEALQALRNANEALVELSSEAVPSSRSGKGKAGAAERAVCPFLPDISSYC